MADTQKGRELIEHLKTFRANLEVYSRECLKIKPKEGDVIRFPGFNSAQRYVHARLEEQKAATGKVRAIILKGRQQGISTYTAVRYYRRATLYKGVGVYILAHEQTAADNLFKIVDRFQTHNPIAPHTGVSNVKELEFDRLDSSYVVATAGQKAGGRGRTITLFHGSEVAFWQSAADHFASSVQTVPDMPGTEIILESTAEGASGEFYERWHNAVAGEGDYIPIFVPWFWQEEYVREVPDGFELSSEPGDTGVSEVEYAKLFKLTMGQMAWRRAKVVELRGDNKFNQEYPASPELAFVSADVKKSLILPIQVLRARKREGVVGAGPLIIGADPSGPGKDRFAVAARQGAKCLWIDHRQMPETPEAVLWLKNLIDEHKPERMFIDLANIGHAIVKYLKAYGEPYATIVRGVNFGATSQQKQALPKVPGPRNRRAEMWDRLLQWLKDEDGVGLPDMDALQADLTGPRVKPLPTGDFLLESKEDMKTRKVRSPDLGDALALTFADSERIIGSESRREVSARRSQSLPEVEPLTPEPAYRGVISGPLAWMG